MRRTLAIPSLALALTAAGCPDAPPPVVARPTPTPTAPLPVVAPPAPASAFGYPATRREAVKDVLHGTTVEDPYRWLEDGKAPDVQTWMNAQDAFAREHLARLPERDVIAQRLKELFYIDALSAPRHLGARYFYSRRHASKEKAIVYWKDGKTGPEHVLFDPNTWSTDGSMSLGVWSVAWDGKTVAYTVHANNSDEATLWIMDVATGKKREAEKIDGGKYAVPSWTPTSDGFYYTWLPMPDPKVKEADRPGLVEVRFHKLGEDPAKDAIVRERTNDPSTFITGTISRDGHWLTILVEHGWTSNDIYFKDLRIKGKQEWKTLVVSKDAHYSAEAHQDQLYVVTDEGAPRGRIFRADPRTPERATWKEIVPEQPDAAIDVDKPPGVFGGRLLVTYLEKAQNKLSVYEIDGKKVRDIPLPGVGTIRGLSGRSDDDEAYYSFESFTQPNEVHALSIKTGTTALYSKVTVPVDTSPYMIEQVFYPSKDGTRISMFIVRRKDLKKDGSTRALLYGYGGFQSSETSLFTASIYPWLEHGGLYAVPNLRGGAEYGEDWHRHGMLLEKQNVFDDHIGAAEYLVKEGYTKSDRLAIYGGSNGGLLVGAAVTQRPDLFSVVLCGVPLLDMVRYHLFGSGKTWTSEYGSADDAAQFKALFAYSPYHHVKAGTKYPPVLLLSADADDRVDPLHARKFAGALQAASTGGPVLLRIEKHSGHGGADLIKAEVEKGADRYAFALAHTASGR
jgi:prolyl oligopeptidase